jgi:hypothetical protein
MPKLLKTPLLLTLLFLPLSTASAINCQSRTYTKPGYACTITEKKNATITVKISVKKTSDAVTTDKIIVDTPGGEVTFTIVNDQPVSYESHYVLPERNHDFTYRAELQEAPDHTAEDFEVTIEAISARPNATTPKATLLPNGDIEFGASFPATTQPLRTLEDVFTDLWYAKADGTLTRKVATLNLRTGCNNKPTPCESLTKVDATARKQMTDEEDKIIVVIDKEAALPETSEEDNSFELVDTDGFKLEEIPAHMRSLPSATFGAGWQKVAKMLSKTWANGAAIAASDLTPGIDWSLPINTDIMRMAWIRNLANALDGRAEESLQKLANPNYFLRPKSKAALAATLKRRFATLGKRTIPISNLNAKGLEYHKQYLQRVSVQAGYYGLSATGYGATLKPDALSSALGAHSLFLVPEGTAKRSGSNIQVTINSVYIHLADSYDFRAGNSLVEQPLGCWSNQTLTAEPHTNSFCISNLNYRNYRQFKNRGGDFVIMTNKLKVPITPITFAIPNTANLKRLASRKRRAQQRYGFNPEDYSKDIPGRVYVNGEKQPFPAEAIREEERKGMMNAVEVF